MHRQIVLALRVDDTDATQRTGIAYFTTHLGVERCLGEDHLIEVLAFLTHLAVTENLRFACQFVIADELGLAFRQYGPVAEVLFVGLTTHRFLVLKGFVIILFVGDETILAQDEFGEVKRETVGIFEREHVESAYLGLTGLAGVCHEFVEQTNTFVERTEESLFLGLDNRRDLCFLCFQFRICFTQVFNQLRHELIEEGAAHVEEGITVTNGTAEDTTNDISGLLVRRQLPVRDGERNRTDVVRNHTHSDVGLLVLAVFAAADVADLG